MLHSTIYRLVTLRWKLAFFGQKPSYLMLMKRDRLW